MLDSIFNVAATSSVTLSQMFLTTLASLVLGLGVAGIYMYRNVYTRSFALTMVLLPAMVQIVIMIVNGNLGTGVAVMGAFSLVRFRSIPGSARDISSIFLAMAVGLAAGMGYLAAAFLFLLVLGLAAMVLTRIGFGDQKLDQREKELKVTIPENLDYQGLFDDLLQKYLRKSELIQVRTTNMGSLYELKYQVSLKTPGSEKEFLDELRCRNGNLGVSLGRMISRREEL